MPKTLHIATKVDANILLNTPDTVFQQMSLKIFQRRQQMIDELIDTRVLYESNGGLRSGKVERIDDNTMVIVDGNSRIRVSLKKIHFE